MTEGLGYPSNLEGEATGCVGVVVCDVDVVLLARLHVSCKGNVGVVSLEHAVVVLVYEELGTVTLTYVVVSEYGSVVAVSGPFLVSAGEYPANYLLLTVRGNAVYAGNLGHELEEITLRHNNLGVGYFTLSDNVTCIFGSLLELHLDSGECGETLDGVGEMLGRIAICILTVCVEVNAELEPEVLVRCLTYVTSVGLTVSLEHGAELFGYGSVVGHLRVNCCVTVDEPVIEHINTVHHKLVVNVYALGYGLIGVELSVAQVVCEKERTVCRAYVIVAVCAEIYLYVGVIAVTGLVEVGSRITEDVGLNGNIVCVNYAQILEVYGIVTLCLNGVLVVCECNGVGSNHVLVGLRYRARVNVGTAGLKSVIADTRDGIDVLAVYEDIENVLT